MRLVIALLALIGFVMTQSAEAKLKVAVASPTGTVIVAPSTSTFVDSAGNTWGISATAPCTATWATAGTVSEVTFNGVPTNTTCEAAEVAFVNGVVWHKNTAGNWYSATVSGTTITWTQGTNPLPSNTPVVTLTWTAPKTNVDGSAITVPLTYNVYQGLSGGTLSQVQSGITNLTATVTAGLVTGTTQCFAVTAVESGQESAQTTPECAAIVPLPTPNSPTQVTTVVIN